MAYCSRGQLAQHDGLSRRVIAGRDRAKGSNAICKLSCLTISYSVPDDPGKPGYYPYHLQLDIGHPVKDPAPLSN
jgi:hypothetical protein